MTRHTRIAPRGQTIRRQGLPPWAMGAAPVGVSAFGKATGGDLRVAAVVDPPGLYIPDYLGTPDVGLSNPGALTLYTGSMTITSGSYSDLEFQGQVVLNGPATFDNCWFWGHGIGVIRSNVGRSTFTDCEMGAQGSPSEKLVFAAGGNYTLIRCNLHDCEDAIKWANGAIFTMLHIHDLITTDPDPHYDGIQAEGSNDAPAKVEYSHISAVRRDGINGNAAIICKADLGESNQNDTIIDNNYLNGGNYTLSVQNAKNLVLDTVVTNNIFGPDYRFGYRNIDSGTILTWANNVDYLGNPVTI